VVVVAATLVAAGDGGGGANRTDFEKHLYFALLYLLSAAVCMYVW
jgi:hypothetical protein